MEIIIGGISASIHTDHAKTSTRIYLQRIPKWRKASKFDSNHGSKIWTTSLLSEFGVIVGRSVGNLMDTEDIKIVSYASKSAGVAHRRGGP